MFQTMLRMAYISGRKRYMLAQGVDTEYVGIRTGKIKLVWDAADQTHRQTQGRRYPKDKKTGIK